ncbi:MAG: ABC transporter ATP-binding protein [Lachnospiraceae bacterium]|nr:ABC transporter ATP-binding protein [Lachnospiraceae bacterium]MDD6169828.1 ABC transporter ATP-binding protein [Lachnospiraceae bacterium]MDY4838288.1 ABC transporter ATP-binding protein [Lachnospiraceae bacterium]
MLNFSHVSVSCQHETILNDISVAFTQGTITSLVGPNGSGKTTLLQCLNGMSTVTSGTILLDGEDYLKIAPKERAKKVAFLPQVRTILPALPVKTLVEHGRFPYLGFTRRKNEHDIKIVNDAMRFTNVNQYAEQSVDTLSGGIRQRVFLAMVLAQDCDYIVLDEPTTYLDIEGQREFLVLLTTLRSRGKTIIVVLHDLNQALRISDSIVVMEEQKIVTHATPKECLQCHILEDVFHTKIKQFKDDDGEYYFFL